MPQLDRMSPYRAETFQERGVYVAMTSPVLAGARVRRMHGMEIALPADGIWVSVAAVSGQTVYDRCLLARLSALGAMTPSLVRAASLSAMAEGLAGRRAKAAAVIAIAADAAARMHTHDHLLRNVIRHLDTRMGRVHPADQASRAMDRLAAETGCSGTELAAGFAELAHGLSVVGLGSRIGTARIPVLLMEIQALRQSVAGQVPQEAVMLITGSADRVLARLAAAVTDIRALADNPVKLAAAWVQDRSALEHLIAEAAWLADGWPWLVHIQLSVSNQGLGRRGVATLLPRLPCLPGQFTRLVPDEPYDLNLLAVIADNEDVLARAA